MQEVGIRHGQIGKLLRLQSTLREQAAACRVSDPLLHAHRLKQAEQLAEEILAAYAAYHQQAERVRRFIERLPDSDERETLKLCYLAGMHTQQAAEVLGYSERHLYRIKQRALMHLEGLRY